MADRTPGEVNLGDAWRSLGHRMAVVGGSFVALLSLFHHAPPTTAALRGGAAWLAVILLTRTGALALGLAYRCDGANTARKNKETSK